MWYVTSPVPSGTFPSRQTHEYSCRETQNYSPLKEKVTIIDSLHVNSGQFLLPNEPRAGKAESCQITKQMFQFLKILDFGIRDKKLSYSGLPLAFPAGFQHLLRRLPASSGFLAVPDMSQTFF